MKLNTRGAAMLLSTIIISAVILVIALALGGLSITENQISFYDNQARELVVAGDACMQEAFIQIDRDTLYTGDTLTIDDASCTIGVSGTGANRSITVAVTKGDFSKNFSATVKIFPSLQILTWQEVSS